MKSKSGFNIFLSLLIIATALLFVYTICFKSVVLLEDPAFGGLYPEKALNEFRIELLKKGFNLRVVSIDRETLSDSDQLPLLLKKYSNRDYMVLSPLVAAAAIRDNVEIPACTVSLGIENKELFTISLKAEERVVYLAAPQEVTLLKNEEIKNFVFGENEKYAVDYRYSGALKEESLAGVLAPDLSVSVMPVLSMDKAKLPASGILVYSYYEI